MLNLILSGRENLYTKVCPVKRYLCRFLASCSRGCIMCKQVNLLFAALYVHIYMTVYTKSVSLKIGFSIPRHVTSVTFFFQALITENLVFLWLEIGYVRPFECDRVRYTGFLKVCDNPSVGLVSNASWPRVCRFVHLLLHLKEQEYGHLRKLCTA